LSFAEWFHLSQSFCRLPAGAPVYRAAIRQASTELRSLAPAGEPSLTMRGDLWTLAAGMPLWRENGGALQNAYENLVSTDPPKPTKYNTAAYLRTEAINLQGKHAEAAQALRPLLAAQGSLLPPGERGNWEYAMGMYLFLDEKYEQAVPHFRMGEKKIKGNHRNDALPFLVISLVRLNRLDEASTEFQRLSKEFSTSTFYSQAAMELRARRRAAEARVAAGG
jgi:hypothetical protein